MAVRTRCSFVHRSISALVVSFSATPTSAFSLAASASPLSNSLSLMGLRKRIVKGIMDGKMRVAAVLSLKGREAGFSVYGHVSERH